jgi:glycerol uptake facilitator-like aquaporin
MLTAKPRHQTEPFFEGLDSPTLVRRALAECVATMALTMVVVFSAQAAWLGELRPLALGVGVPAAVAVLTLAFGPATGAHFNPLVTASQWARGHRSTRCLIGYLCAHIVGGLGGAALAGPLIGHVPQAVPAPPILVIGSEIFASAGLIVIILAASLVMGPKVGLLAVVGWLVMVNLVAPAGPFANPVLAIAIPLAFGSLNGPLALLRVAAELVGFGLALLVIAITYPRRACTSIPSKP